jgi:Fur family ferric uptake transcriptional regulator
MPDRATGAVSHGSECLIRAGLRATAPRLALWRVLSAAQDEPDAVELLRRASAIEPRTSLGTVYRFLRELEQRGLAVSRPVAHQRSRWHTSAGAPLPSSSTSKSPEMLAAVMRLAASFGYQLVPISATRSPAY